MEVFPVSFSAIWNNVDVDMYLYQNSRILIQIKEEKEWREKSAKIHLIFSQYFMLLVSSFNPEKKLCSLFFILIKKTHSFNQKYKMLLCWFSTRWLQLRWNLVIQLRFGARLKQFSWALKKHISLVISSTKVVIFFPKSLFF